MSGSKVVRLAIGSLLVAALIAYTQTSTPVNGWIVLLMGTATLWLGYFAGEEAMSRSLFFRAMRRVPVRPRALIVLMIMIAFGWVPLVVAVCEAVGEGVRACRQESSRLYGDFSKAFTDCWKALVSGEPQ